MDILSDDVINKKETDFILNTISANEFQIEDVSDDNACFYRAIANNLNYATKSNSLNDIKGLKYHGTCKTINEVYQNQQWGFCSDRQERLARYLQGKSYRWIQKNYSNHLKEYDMDIGTMILITHDLDIDSYLDRYRFFAGDCIIEEFDSGKIHQVGEQKGQSVVEQCVLEDRWGGTPELIALSESYKVPIIILTSQKFDYKRNKIVIGKIRLNKPEKNVRFRLLQIIGKQYLDENFPICLLWKKCKNEGHYMSMYATNPQNISSLIKNKI